VIIPPPAPKSPDLTGSQRSLLEQRLQQARRAMSQAGGSRSSIRPRPDATRVPLSHAQERLWFLHELGVDPALYNLYQAVRLLGPLDPAALEAALTEIVRRHDVFRTSFRTDAEGAHQVVVSRDFPPVPRADLSSQPVETRHAMLLSRLQAEARRPFDLAADLLVRALLIRLGPDEHVLLLVMPHIVSDGWTIGVLFRELGTLYEAYSSGKASPLPGLPIRFADYALWERENSRNGTMAKSLAYWRRQLAGAATLEVPADRPRPTATTATVARGANEIIRFPAGLVRSLHHLSEREGVTFFMTLIAGWQAVLHRHTGQDDITIGSCVAGRPQVELERLAGFFVNTIVLRTDLGGQPSFGTLLQRTRETVLGAMAHQEVPFDQLVANLQPERGRGRNPFFEVMFVLQSANGAAPGAPGLRFEPVEFNNGTSKFDLTVSAAETPDGALHVSLEYRTDLFESATIRRLLGHYQTFLAAAVADPARSIAELPLLTPDERRQLTEEWSGHPTPYPRTLSIPEVFAEQVRRAPEAVALSSTSTSLTYRSLDEQSSRLAHVLKGQGAGPGAVIAFCCERTTQVAMLMLAILKTGAAYVSLDPAYPTARLGLIASDSRPLVIVTQEHLRSIVEAALATVPAGENRPPVLTLESLRTAMADAPAAAPQCSIGGTATAFVCYTSGSTGRPKGVCVPHRGIVRLVRDPQTMELGPEETLLQLAPVSFDASSIEIWGALLNGGRLAVFPPGVPSLTELTDFIRRQRVTTLFLTTGLFHQMVDEQAAQLTGLRQLITGGEALSPVHAARARAALPGTRLVNAYGPTENSTITTAHVITTPPPPDRPVPIGRPIANSTVYLLDDRLEPVPIGVPGELYTGGDGVANGYFGRPDLEDGRFVPDPFAKEDGARLYRTGDLARWLPDGTIEFLGRADRQVKLRGFRIELGEIESVLAQHPAVGQAAVTLDTATAAGPRLIAYVVARGEALPEPAALRAYLQRTVPDFMVPAVVIPLARLPLNANGKVDLAALPAPPAAPTGRPASTPPRTPAEERLAAIWCEILGVPSVGAHDNFFALGGHSMAGVRLFARLEREFGHRLPLASLFECPTVAQLAARLEAGETAATSCSSLVTLQPHGFRPPVFFVHGAGGGNLWTYTNLVPHLGEDQPVHALESRGMRNLPEFEDLESMAAHYLREIRTIQPTGPYYLAGYCFGGNVAYEMARQLEAGGEAVAFVGLLDSPAANSSYQRLPLGRPEFYGRFARNTAAWLAEFLSQPVAEQWRFVRRKARVMARKFACRLAGREAEVSVEEVIDIGRVPEIEIGLWQTHLRALGRYQSRPYGGALTLFRTEGHPFLCSFDPLLGWAPLARGGVRLVMIPGAHEQIFFEPHVRELSRRLRQCLDDAQQLSHRSPAHAR
jgi:amino acid adenylation domain-containing protein